MANQILEPFHFHLISFQAITGQTGQSAPSLPNSRTIGISL